MIRFSKLSRMLSPVVLLCLCLLVVVRFVAHGQSGFPIPTLTETKTFVNDVDLFKLVIVSVIVTNALSIFLDYRSRRLEHTDAAVVREQLHAQFLSQMKDSERRDDLVSKYLNTILETTNTLMLLYALMKPVPDHIKDATGQMKDAWKQMLEASSNIRFSRNELETAFSNYMSIALEKFSDVLKEATKSAISEAAPNE